MSPWLIDGLGGLAGLCGVVGFTPQIAKIVRDHDVESISLKMYLVTTGGFALWVAYGLLKQSWPLVAANAIMLVLSATILLLKLRYR